MAGLCNDANFVISKHEKALSIHFYNTYKGETSAHTPHRIQLKIRVITTVNRL